MQEYIYCRVHRVSLPGTRFTAPPWISRQYDEYAAKNRVLNISSRQERRHTSNRTGMLDQRTLDFAPLKQDNLFARSILCTASAGGMQTILYVSLLLLDDLCLPRSFCLDIPSSPTTSPFFLNSFLFLSFSSLFPSIVSYSVLTCFTF